jgi:nucleoside-diphosphate-sugar epimerase
MRKTKILVTGHWGFLGRHLMTELQKRPDYKLFVHEKHSGTWRKNLNVEGIIHLAAVSRVVDAERDPVEAVKTNILLTAKCVELRPKWMILASTIEEPHNVYGFTKRAAESYAELMCISYGIRLIILRLANVYGPGDNEDRLMPRLARGEELHVLETLFPFKYVRVDEVVSEILRDVPPTRRGTYEIFTGYASNTEELRSVATGNPKPS